MNDRYRFDVTCAKCGSELEHVANGKPSSYESRAVVKCTGTCRQQWVLVVHMISAESQGAIKRAMYRARAKKAQK